MKVNDKVKNSIIFWETKMDYTIPTEEEDMEECIKFNMMVRKLCKAEEHRKESKLMLDVRRLDEFRKTSLALKELLKKYDFEVYTKYEGGVDKGRFLIKGYSVEIFDCELFSELVSHASGFHVTTKTDGTIDIEIMFYGIYKEIN